MFLQSWKHLDSEALCSMRNETARISETPWLSNFVAWRHGSQSYALGEKLCRIRLPLNGRLGVKPKATWLYSSIAQQVRRASM